MTTEVAPEITVLESWDDGLRSTDPLRFEGYAVPDAARAPELTRSLRMLPGDLLALGVVDRVLPEDADTVRTAVVEALTGARAGERDARPARATAAALAEYPGSTTTRRSTWAEHC
jgi:hypothetical protein